MFSFRYTKDTVIQDGTKIKLQILLFISSANTDGFYSSYVSQGSAATQLRCGGMFSNHFITNFPQNAWVKKFLRMDQYLAKIWTKVRGLLFGLPCIYEISTKDAIWSVRVRTHSASNVHATVTKCQVPPFVFTSVSFDYTAGTFGTLIWHTSPVDTFHEWISTNRTRSILHRSLSLRVRSMAGAVEFDIMITIAPGQTPNEWMYPSTLSHNRRDVRSVASLSIPVCVHSPVLPRPESYWPLPTWF